MSSYFSVKSHFLALDFDGVIADSIRECLVNGFNAFEAFKHQRHRIVTLEDLDSDLIAKATYLRNFIRSGADYTFIFLALNEDYPINDQESFDRFSAKHATQFDDFHRLFYQERERFSKHQHVDWIRLNPLYAGISDFLKRYEPKEHLYIITTKKIPYALKILEANEIPFIESNAYHADRQNPKSNIVSALLNQHQIPPSDFHFIDDQVDTLIKMKTLGIHLYLAEWGYVNEEQRDRAGHEAIDSLSLDAFLEHFSKTDNPQ